MTAGVAAMAPSVGGVLSRSEEHTSELQSQSNLVCRLLLGKKNYLARGVHPWDYRRPVATRGDQERPLPLGRTLPAAHGHHQFPRRVLRGIEDGAARGTATV